MASKILYVLASAGLGGAEKATLSMARYHTDKYEPIIFFLEDGPLVPVSKELGLETHVYDREFRLRNPVSLVGVRKACKQLIAERGAKIVHFVMPYSYVVLRPGLNLKCVLFQHGPVGGKLDKMSTLIPPDHVFVNSEYTRSEHLRTSIRKSPTTLVPLAPDTSQHQDPMPDDARLKTFIESHTCVALMGRFDPLKGLDFGLRSLSPLLKKNPSLGVVVMGGRFGDFHREYADFLMRLPTQLAIEDQVYFTGPLPSVMPVLKQMDFFVHTSVKREGHGLTALEAMALGVICIAPDEGGIAEFIVDGENGFTYQMGDQSDLRRVFINAHEPNIDLDVIRTRGQEMVRTKYSEDAMMNALEAVYATLLG